MSQSMTLFRYRDLLTDDAKQTLRKAARHGVQLVLHGHRHKPYIGAEQVYTELESAQSQYKLGRVGIIGGGSAGSTSVANDANFFNLLDVTPAHIDLHIYRAISVEGRREAFQPMKIWRAPLTSENGRLTLGDWEISP